MSDKVNYLEEHKFEVAEHLEEKSVSEDKKLWNVGLEIRRIVSEWEEILQGIPEKDLVERVNRQGRNVKHLIGHLIDSASNNHQRMVRLQYSTNLNFPDFSIENDMWISIQQHQRENWFELLQLWKYFNFHIAHVISYTDRSWLKNVWTDGEHEPISLEDLIFNYLAHLRMHVKEISNLLNKAG